VRWPSTGARNIALVAVLLVAGRGTASAQDSRLFARLDERTRLAVQAVIDSARSDKLPTEPLINKALEGNEKGADGARIIAAVRGLAAELRTSKQALGASAHADEVTAGAHALHAGVAARDLRRLKAAAGRRHVTVPLIVVTDLVARAVPPPAAARLVIGLTESGVRDDQLTTFQRDVSHDIERGADPVSAASARARGVRAPPASSRGRLTEHG
jgi:hypothetical protein